ARMWAAIPVVLSRAAIPNVEAGLRLEAYGHAFREANPETFFDLYRRARIMQAILSAAVGGLLFCWARGMFGDAAACLTAVLWAFCPNVLASASIVTTDLAAAGMFVL